MEPILTQCTFTLQVWWTVLQKLGFTVISPGQGTIQDWWIQLQGTKRKGFDSLFALISWQIWKERNARLFRGAESTLLELMLRIKKEGDEWVAAGANVRLPPLQRVVREIANRFWVVCLYVIAKCEAAGVA